MVSVFKRKRHYSCPGDPIHVKYQLQLMKDGTHDLVQVGKEDLRDEIESHQEATDISVILERYRHGDTSVLCQSTGRYFDASNMPVDAFDVYRQVENGRYMFDHLPVDIRAQFNHSFDEFVAQLGTDRFEKAMNNFNKSIEQPKVEESEVKVDEQKQ